jgi:hypothetical protein
MLHQRCLAYLSHGVSVSVEETEGVVRATVNREANVRDIVISVRRSLRASKRALVVRATDVELVVVRAVRLQVLGLNLDSEVNVGTSVHLAMVHRLRAVLAVVDLVLHTDGRLGDLNVSVVVVVVERYSSGDCDVRLVIVALGSYAGPEDDAVGVGVTGGDTVGEVQARGGITACWVVSLDHLVNRDTESRVMLRWRPVFSLALGMKGYAVSIVPVVDVLRPARASNSRQRQQR